MARDTDHILAIQCDRLDSEVLDKSEKKNFKGLVFNFGFFQFLFI